MIGLSIDTDYFSYEDPSWDWGHNESNPIFSTPLIWYTRHALQDQDLFEKCNVKHADVHPSDLFEELEGFGFKFHRKTKIGCGWSHKFAYDFFKKYKPEHIINIDAHPDLWEYDIIDCATWGYHLKKELGIKYTWIAPKYTKSENTKKYKPRYWNSRLNKLGGEVGAVYICQSPAWVPPFNDTYFLDLLQQALHFCKHSKFDFDKGFIKREMPDNKDIEKSRMEYKKLLEKLKKNEK
jgi:hypothetical protein